MGHLESGLETDPVLIGGIIDRLDRSMGQGSGTQGDRVVQGVGLPAAGVPH